jgi:hypothetical protein
MGGFSYFITKVDLKYGLEGPIYYAIYTRASRTLLFYRVKSNRQRAPKITTRSQSEMMGNALFRHTRCRARNYRGYRLNASQSWGFREWAEHDRHTRHVGSINHRIKNEINNDGRRRQTYPLIENEMRVSKSLDQHWKCIVDVLQRDSRRERVIIYILSHVQQSSIKIRL